MYKKAYGIIETLAPLHVGAASGEETGNLNLIFRDQFTQTGIIPSSSIRGRFRSDLYQRTYDEKYDEIETAYQQIYQQKIKDGLDEEKAQKQAQEEAEKMVKNDVDYWYGKGAEKDRSKNYDYESTIKFEHASVVWIPVFCPGQPIVWVTCPRLLKRYRRITNLNIDIESFQPYTSSRQLKGKTITEGKDKGKEFLFFNLGFLTIDNPQQDLSSLFPNNKELPAVIVDDNDIAMIHDMALFRQSRVKLEEGNKVVDSEKGGFFNVEALPESTILVFPIAIKEDKKKDKTFATWKPLENDKQGDVYLGGLESVGFGNCSVTIENITSQTTKANDIKNNKTEKKGEEN